MQAEPGGCRFSRACRLLTARDYGRVFAAAQRSSNHVFTVLARPNELGIARLGLAIARKHLRRAHARNRVKRIVRESFRHNRALLRGLDVVVLARSGTADAERSAMHESLDRHWRRLAEHTPR
ncbi:MAG: ribonuclease P protein component [Ectothiorhodospiraceae bacterium]|nr:ribonuclease P protein component [Chromatiales bacterium]MCP5156506.1 ribonuclease P protein component [Ectothiorhodospiraceae bacterium]